MNNLITQAAATPPLQFNRPEEGTEEYKAWDRERAKQWRKDHPEYGPDYRAKNKERINADSRKWYRKSKLSPEQHKSYVDRKRAYNKAWREKNKERLIANKAAYHVAQKPIVRERCLMKAYGITEADYQRMFSEQGGVCVICRKPRLDRHGRLHVDHCHATGNVRGLLCNYCNTSLGGFGDDPAVLLRAIAYLSGEMTCSQPALSPAEKKNQPPISCGV